MRTQTFRRFTFCKTSFLFHLKEQAKPNTDNDQYRGVCMNTKKIKVYTVSLILILFAFVSTQLCCSQAERNKQKLKNSLVNHSMTLGVFVESEFVYALQEYDTELYERLNDEMISKLKRLSVKTTYADVMTELLDNAPREYLSNNRIKEAIKVYNEHSQIHSDMLDQYYMLY